ncbi:hypothetical protein GQ600_17606 [Phytophthora cactorum]|nr:hypothetical protein GQ600_17606 [Phytophthora cactorum]
MESGYTTNTPPVIDITNKSSTYAPYPDTPYSPRQVDRCERSLHHTNRSQYSRDEDHHKQCQSPIEIYNNPGNHTYPSQVLMRHVIYFNDPLTLSLVNSLSILQSATQVNERHEGDNARRTVRFTSQSYFEEGGFLHPMSGAHGIASHHHIMATIFCLLSVCRMTREAKENSYNIGSFVALVVDIWEATLL